MVEAWPVAVGLRRSIWVYPLINTAHLLGISLLVGSIVTLDMRLLGCWGWAPLPPMVRILRRIATIGLLLALASGACLFVTRAADYTSNPYFLFKIGVVLFGIINAVWLVRSRQWRLALHDGTISPLVKFGAGISLVLWLSALLLGRLVGYR